MPNTMVKSTSLLLPVSPHVTAFSCPLLIHPCRFHRKGISWDAEYNGLVQNVVTSRLALQTGSVSIFQPFLIDPCFHREGVVRDAEHNVRKCRRLVLLAKQKVPEIFTLFIDELYMLGIWHQA